MICGLSAVDLGDAHASHDLTVVREATGITEHLPPPSTRATPPAGSTAA